MPFEPIPFVASLVDYYGELGASDVHLTPTRGVFFVQDKKTQQVPNMNMLPPGVIEAVVEAISPGGMKQVKAHGQLDASFDANMLLGQQYHEDGVPKPPSAYRGRVAVRSDLWGTSMTIRLISRDIPSVASLGIPSSLAKVIERPDGLLLFVGQTGSGKSTSIAALVNEVAQNWETHIYTVEAPIEYVYPAGKSLVTQREVGMHVESFSSAIENAKRSHPRIIVVGEILNAQTASAALLAAASGHLVISTMHAGSTAEAIDTFISMFTPDEQPLVRTQLSQTLRAISVQKLLPKQGGGLVMAQEIAFNTRQFSQLILGNGDRVGDMQLVSQYLLGNGRQEQMVAMEHSLVKLVRNGDISADAARANSNDSRTVDDLLAAAELREEDRSRGKRSR
ncbi:ATPase, T2SS/T4P/T4SS family [Curtobacterium sp. MCBD17_040]|uniref:type IV pilus twitching motility protein PilT n=1 Tax=Curtobacterium sp. MCBD17_040 TaxID=2175674 RepID=UPI000DA9FB05|nr:ATPase, T2SS/T4P/T4SS family [Curtobacterium sp. MCBD17_040]WIB65645.1 ATPase, T2SS/T4P/T4SS family [Curtobacterium sp. MCBD17_040]